MSDSPSEITGTADTNTVEVHENDVILVTAHAKRNGLTSLFFGIGALILAILMFKLLPESFKLLAIFTTSAAIVGLLLGYFKMREPDHSLSISRTEIDYQHRSGKWQLSWDNVQRIDTPKVTRGLEELNLSLVGIRIKEYGPLLQTTSPRLMTHLLMEQRPLLLQAKKSGCETGNCYDDILEEDTFKDSDGKTYRGVQAMFANRMQRLRDGLGYDLYINSAELDRPADEFAELLRSCHRSLL